VPLSLEREGIFRKGAAVEPENVPSQRNIQSVLNLVVECADVSYVAKPLKLHQRWAVMAKDEFLKQGIMEGRMGFRISPMCDPELIHKWARSMKGFITLYAGPKFQVMAKLCTTSSQRSDIRDFAKSSHNWSSIAAANNMFWSRAEKSSEYATLKKKLESDCPAFVEAPQRARKTKLFSNSFGDSSGGRSSSGSRGVTKKTRTLTDRIQMGISSKIGIARRKTEIRYEEKIAALCAEYEKLVCSIEPFPGFVDAKIIDHWPMSRLQKLNQTRDKIHKATVRIATAFETLLEEAVGDSVGTLNFDVMTYDARKGLKKVKFASSASSILKSGALMRNLLGLSKTSVLRDVPEWYSRKLNAIFIQIDSYRAQIKPIAGFSVESLNTWPADALRRVRAKKKEIEEHMAAFGSKIHDVLRKASNKDITNVQFEAMVPCDDAKRGRPAAFAGTPKEIKESKGLVDAIMGFDVYAFLTDSSPSNPVPRKERISLYRD